MTDPFAPLGTEYGIQKLGDGSIKVLPPAAFAGAQAPPPGSPGETQRIIKPELCAQITLAVPLSKVNEFLVLAANYLTDGEWSGPAPAP